MICADRDIVLFNRRLDKETRRELYYPTQISGVSFYEKCEATKNGSDRTESKTYKIRIPYGAAVQDGRQYATEGNYIALADKDASSYWTLRGMDLIIVLANPLQNVNTPLCNSALTEPEVIALAKSSGMKSEPIRLTGYSDNTKRGSGTVMHWRLEGA